MPTYKGVVFFEWGPQGWTEEYFLDAEDRTKAQQQLLEITSDRRDLMTSFARVTFRRVSDIDATRDAQIYSYGAVAGQGRYAPGGDAAIGAEVTQAAVNVRLTGTSGRGRPLLLRGLPNAAINHQNDRGEITQPWRDALARFAETLIAKGFRLRHRVFGAPQSLLSVTKFQDRIYRMTFEAAIVGLAVNSILNVANTEGVVDLDGDWRVVQVAGGVVTVKPRKRKNYGDLVAGGLGTGRLKTYEYEALASATALYPTTRQTGRPSFLPRGRQTVRRD